MSQGEITKRVGTVSFLTILSRVAGLIRDMAIAHAFGTRLAADAFFVAFRIPNLLRRLFAEGALTISFVPIFSESLKRSPEEAKRLSDIAWTLMTLVLILVSLVGIFFAPLLVRLTAWGFAEQPEKFALTVALTRVMFPYILLVSLAALAMGVLNSLKHFAASAASSIFMNLGIIAGALGLTRIVNPPVLGLAIGVLIGGLLQLAIHFPVLRKFGFFPSFAWNPTHPGVRKIVGMMLPAAYGAAVYQFNVIVITLLASFLSSGSIAYLWYADRLMEFPLGVFAISIATVLLPSLSDHAAEKNLPALKETFRYGLRMIFFITLPAAGGLIVLADPIIRLIYEHGTFTADATLQTSRALVCFALGLPFIAGVRVSSNAFFALQDSKTPVKVASLAVVVNLVLSLILMRWLSHAGLALAVSGASLFNFAMHLFDFRKKVGLLGLRKVAGGIGKTLVSTAVMMLMLFWIQQPVFDYLPDRIVPQALGLVLLILLGIALFLIAEFFLKGRELRELVVLLKRRKVPIPPESSDPSLDG